ncbi:MAG TPA: hypothetical protein VGR69_07880 [Candidatus Rubrimentiphilum sp.]|nr:hypothetical protein [Candidatus Rubrimentiphilum sp.]
MKTREVRLRRHLACRPWTEKERSIVRRGLFGRFAIAVEPLLGTLFFALLAWGILWRARVAEPDVWILAPIFALVACGFAIYLIAVLAAPVIAYAQTFKPIYILDGFVRYRGPDDFSEIAASGYVAVLFEDRGLCCEWECFGRNPLPNATTPALVEFSEFGGIHKIDGHSTGVLPDEDLPALAIGIARRMRDE